MLVAVELMTRLTGPAINALMLILNLQPLARCASIGDEGSDRKIYEDGFIQKHDFMNEQPVQAHGRCPTKGFLVRIVQVASDKSIIRRGSTVVFSVLRDSSSSSSSFWPACTLGVC